MITFTLVIFLLTIQTSVTLWYSDFEIDWIHYLQGSLDIDIFCQLCVKPLEKYIENTSNK